MVIFLVGNGLDLHHMFPTSYINFLHTFQFLTENYDESFDSVAAIFGNSMLQDKDGFIKKCYDQHKDIYETVPIQSTEIKQIIEKAKANSWFGYLCNCASRDIKWIDFEKEISRVIEAFSAFFSSGELTLLGEDVTFDLLALKNKEDTHILKHFHFFFENYTQSIYGGAKLVRVKSKYVFEHIAGSGVYYTNDDEIVAKLYDSLKEFSDILQWYLLHFVDKPSEAYEALGIKPSWQSYPHPQRVYSFNYTNTIELLYNTIMVDHIHGNTQDRIVLGINPDANDDLDSIDTLFLQFKKYYQRTFYRTDSSYIQHIKAYKAIPYDTNTDIVVMGHSLDITDKDIIMQIFSVAKRITIMYHEEYAVKGLIKNLVQMYGKDGFDELRTAKNLQFVPQTKIQWTKKAPKD